MTYYPIFIDLKGKTALVVGGGNVAERKIEVLLDCGAKINIVSNELTDKLKNLVEVYGIRHLNEEFSKKHLEGVFLVIAATDDKQLNHKISKIAKKMGLLINAVDQLPDCNFIVPSIVKRGDLLIAISTSGKSPALAQKIRKQLDTQFGSEYEDFLVLMGRVRKEILTKGLSQEENSRFFHEIVESDVLDALLRDDMKRVESTLRRILPEDVALEECLKCLMNRNTL
jgi:precorrin-2 dehydrogenase/sirohydrochlorin ferrochelatase